MNSAAQRLSQVYPALRPEQQNELSEMPQKLALVLWQWGTSSEADRQKIRAQWGVVLPNVPENDPQWVAADAAANRVIAFARKDPQKVTEQELQRAAKDAEMAALECGRPGSPSYNLQNAAVWQQRASEYRCSAPGSSIPPPGVCLDIYRQIAQMNAAASAQQQAANNQALINMQLQSQSQYLNQLHNSLDAINKQGDANGRNNAAHVNNSASDWVVRRVP